MHLATFIKQQFGKVRTVLAGDTCDQGFFHDFPMEDIAIVILNRLEPFYIFDGLN
jgi:hypothetical protein